MNEHNTTVLSLDEVRAARDAVVAPPEALTDTYLRGRQRAVDFSECTAAFFDVTFGFKLKGQRIRVLNNASVAFPAGRKITILGHKGVGKSTVLELLSRRRDPLRGRVRINKRVSWPVPFAGFFDNQLSPSQNADYLSRVIPLDRRVLVSSMAEFIGLDHHSMGIPLQLLPIWVRKRFALLVVIAADFEVHLLDGPVRRQQHALEEHDADALENALCGRPYIQTLSEAKHIRDDCDLVYILHEGHFYMFEDINLAKAGFSALPQPSEG